MKFSIVAAVDEKNGLSKEGRIPWDIKQDMLMFKELTSSSIPEQINAVIMGRITQSTFKKGFLPKRKNIVISNTLKNDNPNITVVHNLDEALSVAEKERVDKIFHIGGARSYYDAIVHPECSSVYLTRVYNNFFCDTFFPSIPSYYKKVLESELLIENDNKFKFFKYDRL